MLYGDYLFSEISEIEAVDCEILFAKTSWKTDKFFLTFSTLFSDFSWTCKSISQQNVHVKALFRNTLSFLYVWFCIQWGEHWWNCVLIILLCKLSDSFDKNPHHLEDDFILIIILWWVVYRYKIGAKKNILMLCLKSCLHNVLKHNWNQYKIWKYTYVHSFPCCNILGSRLLVFCTCAVHYK